MLNSNLTHQLDRITPPVGTGYDFDAAGITDVNKKLARLTLDGTLDTSFNPDIASISSRGVHSLAIQDDGKVLVCSDQLVRLYASGSKDNTFAPVTVTPTEQFSKVKIAGDAIFVGGFFNAIKGFGTRGIAKLKMHCPINWMMRLSEFLRRHPPVCQ